MCPRRHIKEDPDWWVQSIAAYNAYEKGHLPSGGGTDAQPCLFVPIMSTISSALEDERQFDEENKPRNTNMTRPGKT